MDREAASSRLAEAAVTYCPHCHQTGWRSIRSTPSGLHRQVDFHPVHAHEDAQYGHQLDRGDGRDCFGRPEQFLVVRGVYR
ncbi:hypothetical protein SUDANB105_00814 [Streptomyces sp. enrichment culture]